MTSALVLGTVVTRPREPDGLRTMMIVSTVAHAAAITALVAAPRVLGPRHSAEAVGSTGPVWADLTAAPSEPRFQATQPPQLPQPVQARPARPKLDEMVENAPTVTPKPAGQTPWSSSNPSTSGEGDLSTRVLPGMTAGHANIDVCDPEYLGQMVVLIHRNWQQNQNVGGKPIVRFAIQRDGTLTAITLRQPSGYPGLDLAAMRAVTLTRAIPPLPACYPHPHYAMNLTFEYIR
jgi:TonB family protein